jgi:Tfp pilus assembly protein PilO
MQIDRPIAIAIILFIVLLLGFFLVAPEYQNLKALQVKLAQKTGEFNAQYDYYAQITKDYYDMQSRKDDIQKVDDALPQDSDYGQLVYYFQKRASDNGLILKNMFLSQSSMTNDVKNLVFSLNLLGNYSSLENFIISLEKSSRIFDVSTITFGAASQSSTQTAVAQFQQQQTFNFNIEVKTHSY